MGVARSEEANLGHGLSRIVVLIVFIGLIRIDVVTGTVHSTQDCPCIDVSQTFASLTNCRTEHNEPGILLDSQFTQSVCLPLNYGSNHCAAHDLLNNPLCFSSSGVSSGGGDHDDGNSNGNGVTHNAPTLEFCAEEWCYVDINKCKMSTEDSYQSSLADKYPSLKRNLFYSYSVCNSTIDDWHSYETTRVLEGKELLVTIPMVWDPAHYKISSNGSVASSYGPEYYDDSQPWSGFVIDYLTKIVQLSNLKGLNYTYRSIRGDKVFPTSKSEASILDVQHGLSDMSASAFWITASRLAMTPFTTPIAVDKMYLVIPNPGMDSFVGGSLFDNALKVLKPFKGTLWGIIVLLVFVVACVNVWLSTTMGFHSDLYHHMNGPKWENASHFKRFLIVLRTLMESFIIFASWMFAHSVEMTMEQSTAQKILMFGFAFLILIAIAAYTANLTAFLTISGDIDYISSIDEAIAAKIPICARQVLEEDLELKYPRAQFVYASSQRAILDDYEAGKCEAIVASMLSVIYTRNMDRYCELDLVSTGAVVLEKNIGFAIQDEYAAAMSYWISDAEKKGFTFDFFLERRKPPLECSLELSLNQNDELLPMAPENFILPIFVCVCCALLAVIIHMCRSEKGDEVENVTLAKFPSNFPETFQQEHNNDCGINLKPFFDERVDSATIISNEFELEQQLIQQQQQHQQSEEMRDDIDNFTARTKQHEIFLFESVGDSQQIKNDVSIESHIQTLQQQNSAEMRMMQNEMMVMQTDMQKMQREMRVMQRNIFENNTIEL